VYWTDVADGPVATFRVVKPFNVIEDIGTKAITGTVLLPAQPFGLQGWEEAFHCRVIPAVSTSAHAASNAVWIQQPLEILAGVLGGFNRSEWCRTACGLPRLNIAISNASMTNCAAITSPP
jgi:polyferredoxin